MRVLIVANVNSTHTQKWCLALKNRGNAVALFSIDGAKPGVDWFEALDHFYVSPHARKRLVNYFPLYLRLRSLIRSFRPDILHSHFLTNYTLLANLSGFQKHIATAWGSDIFLYPRKNSFTASLVRYNMQKARALISTSHAMAAEMKKYTSKKVHVIPFGIDLTRFSPSENSGSAPEIIIGCFKHLEKIYAPEVLLEVFVVVSKRMEGTPVKLLLAGSGSMLSRLQKRAVELGVQERVEFAGWIPPARVPEMLQKCTVCVYLSRQESFGVSLLEAMACRKPLVVTPTVGFKEVAGEEGAALFCRMDDAADAAAQILRLLGDRNLYNKTAEKGYKMVTSRYDLNKNIDDQLALYRSIIDNTMK